MIDRSKVFIKNTLLNYIFRIIGILLGFVTIPITLKYLGDEKFGIWQTMLSIISWASLANFGIGNGLRNKISEDIAKENLSQLKNNISSAYIVISRISIIIFCIMSIIILFINPKLIFKEAVVSNYEIKIAFIIIIVNFCINFVLGLCSSIAYGIHKSFVVTIQQTGISLITFIAIYTLNKLTNGTIIDIAITYTIINILFNILLSIMLFRKNINLKPSLKYDKNLVDKGMYKLGLKFFLLQIGSLILASTDNFLIASLISTNDVTYYSIVNKLFMTINTFYSILLIQLWNSSTDAFARNDYKWIIDSIKKLLLLLIPVALVILFIILGFDFITTVWIGRVLDINKNLLVFTGIYIFMICLNGIFVNIQNGIGKINTQIISVCIAAIINIPSAYIFINKFNMGMSGVVLANIISQLVIFIFCPINVILNIKKSKKSED